MTENVDIVDENDNLIRVVSRKEMREKKLLHRVATILIFNDQNEILLQKRTQTKDIHPGMWDASAGETVLHGESYNEAAQRGLKEELGIDVPLTFLFKIIFHGPTTNSLHQVYKAISEGSFKHQQEEIETVKWVSLEQLKQEIDQPIYSPSFQKIFHEYCGRHIM